MRPGGDNAFPMPDQAKPLVSALVVSYNAKDLLLQCLQAFYSSADVPVEAVVVDNDSSDGSAAAVTDEFPQATVLVQPKNVGYGRAANIGLERCQGRFVLLLGSDVKVDPQSVGRLADFLLTRPDAGAVGPRLLLSNGRPDPDARRAFPLPSTLFYRTVGLSRLFPKSPRFGRYNMGHVPESDVHEMDAGTGSCLMLRMAALDRVGFFDPRYFMFGEDLDLCYRLKLGGWKVFYLPTAGATRHLAPAAPEMQRQISYERHRSMWAYHFKHHAEDVSAFGNGLVWAQIWGRWAAERVKGTVKRPKRESG
jgi:GT2 family glycosyltransferase